MRALVLGSTGHIGQGVIRELLGSGYAVTAATHRRNGATLRHLRVDVVVGDLGRSGQLSEWAAGHDVIVDAAAPKPLGYFFPPRGDPDPIRSARRRSREMVDVVEGMGVPLVYVSSFSTLPRTGAARRGIEARWRQARNVYFQAKAVMERPLLDGGRRGLPIAIVNPTGVFGPWETCPPEESVVATVLAGRLPVAMRHVVNVIDIRDLAAAIRSMIEVERYGAQTPMSGHDIMMDELVHRIADLGDVARPVAIDPGFAVAAGIWLEGVFALMGRHAPTGVCAAPVVADGWPMGTSAHIRALGVEPRPLEETLADAVRWRRARDA